MTRVRALAVVGTLAIAALVLVVVTVSRDSQGRNPLIQSCKPGEVPVSLDLPQNESEVSINVFNATTTPGLAGNVAADFRNRGFQVDKTEDHKIDGQITLHPEEVAILRYGPKAIGGAHLLRAYFLNGATVEFDVKREDALIDVVIGGEFKQLATPTEMRQAMAILGRAELPPGTCEG